MSDYLENLLARQLERLETVEPRRPSRFEPPAAAVTFPPVVGRPGDAPDEDARETGDAFRTGMTEAFMDTPDAFADSPVETTRTSSPSPTRRAPLAPSRDDAPTQPLRTHEATPHAPKSSAFEPETAETISPSEPLRPQPFGVNDDAADSLSPSPSRASSPPPEAPSEPARRTATDEAPSTGNRPQASLSSEETAAPLPVERVELVERVEIFKPSPPQPSPSGLEAEAKTVGASSGPAAPTRETILVPVLDTRETLGRAAPVREGEARMSHSSEAPPIVPQPSKPPVRVDESVAKREAVEPAPKPAPKPARLERDEGSEYETLKARRERQRQASAALVEPRITRRAEARAAAFRQAEAQSKAEPAPTINVTIGRIEIRATAPASRPAARRETESAAPMSLEDYLRRRGGGGGR